MDYVPAEAPIPDYVGLKAAPAQQQAGLQMAAPFAQMGQDIDKREAAGIAKDKERREAEDFRKVLDMGQQGMYQYAKELEPKYPELANRLKAQIDGFSPLFKMQGQDPKRYQDFLLDFYKNAEDSRNDLDKVNKVDPLLELKKKNFQSMIDSRKARDRIARMQEGKKSKSAKAAAKAWELAETQLGNASTKLEALLKQTAGTRSPKWQEQVDQAQMEYNRAEQFMQNILLRLEDDDSSVFFDMAPGAELKPPPKPEPKPGKRKYTFVEVKKPEGK